MKKALKLSIFFLAVAIIATVAIIIIIKNNDDKPTTKQEEQINRSPLDEASIFHDYVFEQIVRRVLTLPEGEIDTEALKQVTQLDLSGPTTTDTSVKIQNLYGLRYFPNLTDLVLDYNAFETLNGIEKLTKLKTLSLEYCRINDATILKNLPNMEEMSLKNKKIIDFSFI